MIWVGSEVRWAAVEAVQRLGAFRDHVGARRGRNIGVGPPPELTELVFYGLRGGQIRRHPAVPTASTRAPAA